MLARVPFDNDETPTAPRANIPSAALVLAARVDRLAELAQQRLLIAPDEHTLVAAAEDLSQIRRLCNDVLR